MALSAKRRVFIEEYLRCWNASEAARRAGYRTRANTAGRRLMSNADIQAEIKARIAERAMGADEVLERLAEHARGTMADFLEVRSNWVRLDIEQAKQAGVLHLIKKFRQTKQGTEVELYDAQAALQLLGKHLGLFKDLTELTGKDGGPIQHEEVGLNADQRDRAMSALADTLAALIHRGGASGPGDVGAAE